MNNNDLSSSIRLHSHQTGECLEIGGDDRYRRGHTANLWGYWGGANQQWIIQKDNNELHRYRIINRNSKQELAVGSSNTGYSIRTNIDYEEYNAIQDYKSQIYIYRSSSGYKITSYYYGVESQLVYNLPTRGYVPVVSFSSRYEESWDIVDVSTNQNVYQVTNAFSGKALSATANGSNRVSQWTNWSLAGQQWLFEPAGADPLYPGHQLWAVHARTDLGTLEIGGGYNETLQAGRGANTWSFWNRDLNSSNQLWRILDDNNNDLSLTGSVGPYRLLNVRTGYALEVSGSTNEALQEDRSVVQYYYWGGDKQKWYISYAAANRPANPGTVTSTSSTKAKESLITLAPNPARNQLTLALSAGKMPAKVELIDAKGSTRSLSVQAGGQIDISSLSAGLYVLRIFNGFQTLQSKFIKE
ncbi:RICIN domain-containing protein [Hymenobacter sp. ISL-91]|uniref:RICIN domain-containing protein n=1 Tax=Hymenobacter sp. ISL-91 TaxID=2819151 RepID=UPI001BE4E26F|nr:RICIN domain-containing protein [Hymenobacter sp. ISL-91]MBT2556224.1 RICIN domain-containing protein [Hymenobacter sp. ISL-91]